MSRPSPSAQRKGVSRCPRFDSCNAPICPLDPNWDNRRHLPGDPVCLWLREAVKQGGIARIACAATGEIAAVVAETLPAIEASSSDIRHKLKVAARSGSKLENMRAARERLTQLHEHALDGTGTTAGAHAVGRPTATGGQP